MLMETLDNNKPSVMIEANTVVKVIACVWRCSSSPKRYLSPCKSILGQIPKHDAEIRTDGIRADAKAVPTRADVWVDVCDRVDVR